MNSNYIVFLKKFYLILILSLPFTFTFAQDAIYHVSLNKMVRLGHYDGVRTLKETKTHGNFGLGSIEGIAAELVMINDTAYQISAREGVKIMEENTRLPFASVKFFVSEKNFIISKNYTLKELQKVLDSVLNKNAFAAIRITGTFENIEYYCYLPQHQPYQSIKKAQKKMFTENNTSGTIVSFYTPKAAEVINSPVYHFHFINSKRTNGGHVENCRIKNVVIEIDYANELIIALPDPNKALDIDLGK